MGTPVFSASDKPPKPIVPAAQSNSQIEIHKLSNTAYADTKENKLPGPVMARSIIPNYSEVMLQQDEQQAGGVPELIA